MAVPTNAYQTYSATALREDLENVIKEVSQTERPVQNALPRTKVDARYHEWLTYSLPSAAANAAVEGDDASLAAAQAEAKVGNRSQILEYAYGVSGTMQAVNKAGGKDELAKQRMRHGEMILNDLEKALCANTAQSAGNASTAATMGGLETWIATNATAGATGDVSSGDGTDTNTAGTARAYTETLLKDTMQSCYENGGKPSLVVHDPYNRRVASSFNGIATYEAPAEKRKVFGSVRVYESDFGTLDFVSSIFSVAGSALFLDPTKASVGVLRPMQIQKLAKTGDSEKEQMLMEATLIVDNEAAHGALYGLTTSAS